MPFISAVALILELLFIRCGALVSFAVEVRVRMVKIIHPESLLKICPS